MPPTASLESDQNNQIEFHPPLEFSTTTRDTLNILQWNADGLTKAKIFELREKLKESNIDICCIQETKLFTDPQDPSKSDPVPIIPGYEPIRQDRKIHSSGGGLLTYIRHGITFQRGKKSEVKAQEFQEIKILLKKSWFSIINFYLPNTKTQITKFDPSLIPSSPIAFIVGDFNGHSRMWDQLVPQDKRGEEVEKFILDHNLFLLNDGEPTRVNRGTGGGSTPDLTICGQIWSKKTAWAAQEQLGDSDHLPILSTISLNVNRQNIPPRKPS